MKEIKNVCVYCASSSEIASCYVDAADRLGKILGYHKLRTITGGGVRGLMKVVEDAALKAGGDVLGIIPRFMVEAHWEHSGIELLQVESMSERKSLLNKMADAIIVLPGGYGTLDELGESLTLKQLGLIDVPIILLNTNNFYDALIKQMDVALKQHFMRDKRGQLFVVAQTPEEINEQLNQR
jgi:uncharacterized protein (TIGR00730 family)